PGPRGLRAGQDRVPALGHRLRPGRRPDGVGAAALHRQPRDAVHVVPAPRIQLLHGRHAGAGEPVLLSSLDAVAIVHPAGLFQRARGLSRGEPGSARLGGASRLSPSAALGLVILGFGMFYGGVMGTYGGLAGDRPVQLVYSAVKVPFLIMTTFALSVP